MGKVHLITKTQEIILAEIKRNSVLSSQFYFTGGTALSSVYLQHRYSEDLDFFSPQKLDQQMIFGFMQEWSQKHNFTFQSRFADVVYIFNLTFPNKEHLKVDFGYYPYKRLEEGTKRDTLDVDSLFDIATNKLLTISQRYDVKDFVDIFFLLKTYTIWDLIPAVQVKFHVEIEPLLLGADFLKAEEFEYLPKMIKPLTLEELKAFFRKKAKEIGKTAVE